MGKLFVIGIGPGDVSQITPQARVALETSQVLCGYGVYTRLVEELFWGEEIITTPMTQEMERCRLALSRANAGKTVALVCSGDAGIYGMAGPILELAPQYPEAKVEILPGITAALSGAALLGAPLMNDFCVVSLSDLLTPWEVIEQRLHGAGSGDFALCLYNPMSKKRQGHLRRACDILLQYRSGDTPCGWVQNIGREGETTCLLTLEELRDAQVDMFTTVFIGSSQTRRMDGRLVTLRGYRATEDAEGR